MKYALAVDIGATKAALALVDSDFAISHKVEVATGSSDDIWERIAIATKKILEKSPEKISGIGIGSAGPLHLAIGAISPVNIPSWRTFPIVERFKEVTGIDHVVLHGDAMALADAEHKLGAGRGSANMLGMVVSTGVGGGLIINNELVLAETGNASYFGHHSIAFDGDICMCGRQGCVEAYASGTSMVKRAIASGWKSSEPTFIELAQAARDGDAIALSTIDAGAHALAVAIVNVCAIADVTTVVVGGGVAEAGDIYWNHLRTHIAREVEHISFLHQIELKSAELVRDAGILGAALGVLKK